MWCAVPTRQVVAITISTSILTNGEIDVAKLRPVARLGYSQEYSVIRQVSYPPLPEARNWSQ